MGGREGRREGKMDARMSEILDKQCSELVYLCKMYK